MAGRLRRGWSMARASFAVLKQHPRLVIFPMMSGTVFLLVAGAILAALWPEFARHATNPPWQLACRQFRKPPVLCLRVLPDLRARDGRHLLQCGADPLRAASATPATSRPSATAFRRR